MCTCSYYYIIVSFLNVKICTPAWEKTGLRATFPRTVIYVYRLSFHNDSDSTRSFAISRISYRTCYLPGGVYKRANQSTIQTCVSRQKSISIPRRVRLCLIYYIIIIIIQYCLEAVGGSSTGQLLVTTVIVHRLNVMMRFSLIVSIYAYMTSVYENDF